MVPLENTEPCQRLLNGVPFGLMVRALRNGLKAVEDSGFCCSHLLQEFFAFVLQKRGFLTGLATLGTGFWAMGNSALSRWPPAQRLSSFAQETVTRRGGKVCIDNTHFITLFASAPCALEKSGRAEW